MANPISWLLAKLFGFFAKLDPDTKEKIADIVVEAFQSAFRNYFQQKRSEDTKGNSNAGGSNE